MSYFIIIYLFQMQEILAEFGEFGKYSVYILLGLGNLLFVAYDFALTQITRAYIYWFRPRFLRRSAK